MKTFSNVTYFTFSLLLLSANAIAYNALQDGGGGISEGKTRDRVDSFHGIDKPHAPRADPPPKIDKPAAPRADGRQSGSQVDKPFLTWEGPKNNGRAEVDPLGNGLIAGGATLIIKGAAAGGIQAATAAGAASALRSTGIGVASQKLNQDIKEQQQNNLKTGRGGPMDPRFNPFTQTE